MSFIYTYKTSIFTLFVKQHNILNLTAQNVFYVQSYVESAFLYNSGSTFYALYFVSRSHSSDLQPKGSREMEISVIR